MFILDNVIFANFNWESREKDSRYRNKLINFLKGFEILKFSYINEKSYQFNAREGLGNLLRQFFLKQAVKPLS